MTQTLKIRTGKVGCSSHQKQLKNNKNNYKYTNTDEFIRQMLISICCVSFQMSKQYFALRNLCDVPSS